VQRRLVVVVLGVVAVALALAAFVGPWWVVTESSGSNQIVPNDTWQYGLFEWTFTGSAFYLPIGQTETVTSNYSSLPSMGSVLLAGLALEASGMTSGLGMVALVAMSRTRPALRRPAAAAGLVAFFLVLAAALVVMLYLPAAANVYWAENALVISGFWGSSPNTMTWGAGWAWYTLLAAAALFLIDGVGLFRTKIPSARQAASVARKQS
jgi:hypothetical protein